MENCKNSELHDADWDDERVATFRAAVAALYEENESLRRGYKIAVLAAILLFLAFGVEFWIAVGRCR